jgi:O-antigen ligase
MYTRELMKNIGEGDGESAKLAKRIGIFSYGLVHVIPTILPLIIYNVKENKQKVKFLWLVFLLILCYIILKLSFGTVIILSLFIVPATFLISINRKKNILLFFILGILSIPLLNNDNIISSLDYVKPFFENTVIFNKIEDINNSFKYGTDGSVDDRKILYESSLNVFMENPIFGTYNHSDSGEHSFIIDFLAWFGLIGTIPLLLCFIEVLKTNYKILPSKVRIYYLLSVIPFVFLSFVKGTPFFEQLLYLFIFIPGLFLTLYSKNKIIKSIQ